MSSYLDTAEPWEPAVPDELYRDWDATDDFEIDDLAVMATNTNKGAHHA